MATALPNDNQKLTVQLLPTVLVVEDNPDDFFLLQRAFNQAGMCAAIHRAQDGQQAKAYLQQAEQSGGLPICIVTDLMMPLMNGFELVDFVKSNPKLMSIPIIILSTSANERDIARAYQLGANSYIVKPSSFASLVAISHSLNNQWLRPPL